MIDDVVVVIPARDEEALVAASIEAVGTAAARCAEVPVGLVLVLDRCADATPVVARRAAERFVRGGAGAGAERWLEVLDLPLLGSAAASGVGVARHRGVRGIRGARSVDAARTWVASTDADTTVPAGWLRHHLAVAAAGVVAMAGSVTVSDWSPWSPGLDRRWTAGYEHAAAAAPVHGANLGIRLDVYERLGGFADLTDGEDRDLFERVRAAGLPTAVTTAVPVATSGRRVGRAPAGFSGHLRGLERSLASAAPAEA